ncbi:MAG: FprA family A-type flavoprotein [Candidatus Omnitrophica bacterium]|nr:FprA family A-type flavoprotein [Candidatus Omnitrophota bacterium]
MIEIKKGVYWTGCIDWNLRIFHGYSTPFGTTYNAYLILDEKPVLIDTVKHYGFDEMFSRIQKVISPSEIRYIVSNHTEMDHSGSIDKLLDFCPNAEIVCSPNGREGLTRHFAKNSRKEWNFKVVNNSDTLNIGSRILQFFLMPMVHWPDSMATYCPQDKILFPNDAFGQHYASFGRFADEVGLEIILKEAEKYYANIVMPYGGQVLKALDALAALSTDLIAPSHGLIWRREQDIEKIVKLYRSWANYESQYRAVIIYDTMWHSTEKMATTLYRLFEKEKIPVKIFSLATTHISDIVAEIMLSKAVLIGSPMLNNKMLPTMAALLTYLKGLKPKNRLGFTFGSYGWAKAGFKEMEEALQEAGMNLLVPGQYFNYIPDASELESLSDTVASIKRAMQEGKE